MPAKADAQAMPPNLASDFDVDFKMSHVDAAARLQVISSGGLPQVRLSAPGAFPGSTTRPRALADAAQGRCPWRDDEAALRNLRVHLCPAQSR